MINLGIVSNFYIGIYPAYHGFCPRGSAAVDELRGIWILPFP